LKCLAIQYVYKIDRTLVAVSKASIIYKINRTLVAVSKASIAYKIDRTLVAASKASIISTRTFCKYIVNVWKGTL
jgi:hypothetical protein